PIHSDHAPAGVAKARIDAENSNHLVHSGYISHRTNELRTRQELTRRKPRKPSLPGHEDSRDHPPFRAAPGRAWTGQPRAGAGGALHALAVAAGLCAREPERVRAYPLR